MNLNFFYIIDTNIKILEEISNEGSYYSNFYKYFKSEISEDDYKKSLSRKFENLTHSTKSKIILKILKNTFLNHISDFETTNLRTYELLVTTSTLNTIIVHAEEFEAKNGYYEFLCDKEIVGCYPIDRTIIKNIDRLYYNIEDADCVDDDIKKLSMRMFSNIKNKNLIDIFTILLKDNEKFYHYYLLYFEEINRNFNIEKNPIEIIIEDRDKIFVWEGIHRFILCLIKDIKPKFIVKHSNYKTYDEIIFTLEEDYKSMYKRLSPNELILYNEIPHTLFENYKSIREDRSKFVISFLNEYKCETGLEIGPQNGLLSIKLAESGYKMDCLEYEKKYYELIKNVVNICEQEDKVSTIFSDIYDYNLQESNYDFIVSLSVFYHLKRNDKEKFETLFIELLNKTKILIFDDEPNTNILTQSDILSYVEGLDVKIEVIHEGCDNRRIYAIVNDNI